MAKRNRAASLTREDWCRAALLAFGEVGERAFAVEPLARRLGVTKGSFYWHFDNRADLLRTALDFWKAEGTARVISDLESVDDAVERLRQLISTVLGEPAELRAEAALQAAAAQGHPVIGPVVAEVNEQRLAYLAMLYEGLGAEPAWADAAYAAYVGACALGSMRPEPLSHERLEAMVQRLQMQLVPSES